MQSKMSIHRDQVHFPVMQLKSQYFNILNCEPYLIKTSTQSTLGNGTLDLTRIKTQKQIKTHKRYVPVSFQLDAVVTGDDIIACLRVVLYPVDAGRSYCASALHITSFFSGKQ